MIRCSYIEKKGNFVLKESRCRQIMQKDQPLNFFVHKGQHYCKDHIGMITGPVCNQKGCNRYQYPKPEVIENGFVCQGHVHGSFTEHDHIGGVLTIQAADGEKRRLAA